MREYHRSSNSSSLNLYLEKTCKNTTIINAYVRFVSCEICAVMSVFDVSKQSESIDTNKEKDCPYVSRDKNEPLYITVDFKYFLICNFF